MRSPEKYHFRKHHCCHYSCYLTHRRNKLARPRSRMTSTIECSQLAAWTTNRSLVVISRVYAFPGRTTNSGSTIARAAHLDGGVIECHKCTTSHSGSASTSLDMRLTPLALSRMPLTTSIPAPTQPIIAMTNYTYTPTVTNSSAFLSQIVLY